MIRLPQVHSTERTSDGVRLTLAVPATLEYFDGHFPGCPLLPGVVQIGWAIGLARQHLAVDGGFRSLSAVKFTRVIQPGATVDLLLELAAGPELSFEYQLDGLSCSGGRVLFTAGAA